MNQNGKALNAGGNNECGNSQNMGVVEVGGLNAFLDQLSRWFVIASGALLILTALAKLIGIPLDRNYLSAPAPVFNELSWRTLLVIAAFFEILCGIYAIRNRGRIRSLVAILWLAAIFCLFKIAILITGYSGPCNCFGFIGDWLGMSRKTLEATAWTVLIILIGGSLGLLVIRINREMTRRLALVVVLGALVLCMVTQTKASDFCIHGEQETVALFNGKTGPVQRVSFTAIRSGKDWSIVNSYPDSSVKQQFAYVDGRMFTVTLAPVDNQTAGAVFEDIRPVLEAAPEFTRVIFVSFLMSERPFSMATNMPVPFLFPLHPAMYSYDWVYQQADKAPYFPSKIQFRINDQLVDLIPKESMQLFYRARIQEQKKLFDAFRKSQQEEAEFSVTEWTNCAFGMFPQRVILKSPQYDDDFGYLQRIHTVKVTAVEGVEGRRLMPSLSPNSYVQYIISGSNYLHRAEDGKWLSTDDARQFGVYREQNNRLPPSNPKVAMKFPLLIRALILFLLLLPIIVWFSYRRINRQTQ